MRIRVRVLAGEAERIRAAASAEGVEIREWLRLAVEDAVGTWQPPDGPPALRMEVELPDDVAERARTLARQMGIGTLCELTRRAALDRLQRNALAEKWGVSLPVLGELIRDHCARL